MSTASHPLRESSSASGLSAASGLTIDAEEHNLGSKAEIELKGVTLATAETTTPARPWLTKGKIMVASAVLAALVVVAIAVPIAVKSSAGSDTSSVVAGSTNGTSPSTTSTNGTQTGTTPVVDPTIPKLGGMCGPLQGRDLATYPTPLKCLAGECCGKAGYCGVGPTFCGTLCQADYGVCGGDLANGYRRSALRTAKQAVMVGDNQADFTKPMCGTPGQVAITFDDGPYMFTEKILDDLKALNVKATFFVNGRNYGDIYEYNRTLIRAVAEGHQIGHHTWSHPVITDRLVVPSFDALDRNELLPLESAFKSIIGIVPTYLRPPNGEFPTEYLPLVGAAGYSHVVTWNLNTLDTWGCETAACVSQNTARALVGQTPATASFVQLSHDPLKITADGWAATVTLYRNAGFTQFVTVHECLTGALDLKEAYSQ